MLTGNELTEGAVDVYRYDDNLIVTSGSVELSRTPVGNLLGVYLVNTDGTLGEEIESTDYTLSGKNIEFDSIGSPVDDGTKVAVYYRVKSDATAKTLKVTSDKFGQTFKVTLDCLVRDELTKADYAAQIVIPNAKFEDNFNLSLAVDGDPAVLDLNMEVLKDPTSTDMWLMHIYDEDEVQ